MSAAAGVLISQAGVVRLGGSGTAAEPGSRCDRRGSNRGNHVARGYFSDRHRPSRAVGLSRPMSRYSTSSDLSPCSRPGSTKPVLRSARAPCCSYLPLWPPTCWIYSPAPAPTSTRSRVAPIRDARAFTSTRRVPALVRHGHLWQQGQGPGLPGASARGDEGVVGSATASVTFVNARCAARCRRLPR
jgi:hypothetical protein